MDKPFSQWSLEDLYFFSTCDKESELLRMIEFRPADVREIRGKYNYNSFKDLLFQGRVLRNNSSYIDLCKDLGLDLDLNQDLVDFVSRKAKVSPVREPLKVRLITKGNTYKYWISRWFQKKLWSLLRNWKQFTLIGEPVSETLISDILEKSREEFDFYVSGDYSAATDNLKIEYTKLCFEKILTLFHIDEEYKNILREVLYEHTIVYPSEDPELSSFEQKRGQLMGSTLSFPILCLVNLIVYWISLEDYSGHLYEPADLPVLVNGDDILFKSCDEHYNLWKTYAKEVGFELSIGKNYTHKDFLMINSMGFRGNLNKLQRIPWLNVGLLTGQSKLGKIDDITPIWDYYNFVLWGAQNKQRIHKRFLHYHSKWVKALTFNGYFNIFFDRRLGGLGFDHYDEIPLITTRSQRSFGGYLYSYQKQDFQGTDPNIKGVNVLMPKRKLETPDLSIYHFGRYKVVPMYHVCSRLESEPRKYELSGDFLHGNIFISTPQGEDRGLILKFPRDLYKSWRNSIVKPADPKKLLKFPYKVIELLSYEMGFWELNHPKRCSRS
jgi:hypothetical protein